MKNREIKFRIWDKTEKNFEYSLEESSDNRYEIYSTPRGHIKEALSEIVKSDEYAIQQFTGLFDKNDKEIYEGDILHVINNPWTNFVSQVSFCRGCFIVLGNPIDPVNSQTGDYNLAVVDKFASYSKIIGNVFENPELLK